MPASLTQQFQAACDSACDLAEAGERVRVLAAAKNEITISRLEYLYEISYLRIFIAWEDLLEQTFVRYMCGFTNSIGQVLRAGGAAYHGTLLSARAALYGTQQYLLWHNVQRIVQRSQTHFTNGLHETVILSHQGRLDWFSAVRHRVAHGQDDARQKFDLATMGLAGRRYPASRVGRFLRDTDTTQTPPSRWLVTISREMIALANQLVP